MSGPVTVTIKGAYGQGFLATASDDTHSVERFAWNEDDARTVAVLHLGELRSAAFHGQPGATS